MDSDQAKAGFSISNLLGFDRAQAEQPETSDNRHQLNLSENTGERERATFNFCSLLYPNV